MLLILLLSQKSIHEYDSTDRKGISFSNCFFPHEYDFHVYLDVL